jgi:hypothetical protein
MKCPDFAALNSLAFKEPAHRVSDLRPQGKNYELKVIVLGQVETANTKKNDRLTRFLVADDSGSVFANFFGSSALLTRR